MTRRQLLALIGGLVGGAGAGALYRTANSGRRHHHLLRPPGARPERQFLAACIRCGQCVQACPFDTLKLVSTPGRNVTATPYVKPEDVPCYLCQEYDSPKCIDACPTSALRPVDDLRDVGMGTAIIDQTTCLPYNGVSCRACWHACPYPNEAIRLNHRLRPKVDADRCVGCGLCEHACPTSPRSIKIRPASATENA